MMIEAVAGLRITQSQVRCNNKERSLLRLSFDLCSHLAYLLQLFKQGSVFVKQFGTDFVKVVVFSLSRRMGSFIV